jgi:hypothetical protein
MSKEERSKLNLGLAKPKPKHRFEMTEDDIPASKDLEGDIAG